MSHDKQDKRLAESRSKLGTMSWEEMNRAIGVSADPEDGELESGTPDEREVGIDDTE